MPKLGASGSRRNSPIGLKMRRREAVDAHSGGRATRPLGNLETALATLTTELETQATARAEATEQHHVALATVRSELGETQFRRARLEQDLAGRINAVRQGADTARAARVAAVEARASLRLCPSDATSRSRQSRSSTAGVRSARARSPWKLRPGIAAKSSGGSRSPAASDAAARPRAFQSCAPMRGPTWRQAEDQLAELKERVDRRGDASDRARQGRRA